jgi:hypothetical protein
MVADIQFANRAALPPIHSCGFAGDSLLRLCRRM